MKNSESYLLKLQLLRKEIDLLLDKYNKLCRENKTYEITSCKTCGVCFVSNSNIECGYCRTRFLLKN